MTTTSTGPALSLPLARPSPLHAPEILARLRADDPVAAVTTTSGEPGWLVTRYADARTVLTDPRFRVAIPGMPDGGDAGNDSLFQDPPGHTRLRRLVSAAFTPRRVAALRYRVEQLTDGLLDRVLVRGGPVDLMEAVTFPVPITVISELLGVPPEERARFRDGADTLLSLVAAGTDPGAGWQQIAEQVGGLVTRKRMDPGDDLLSALIAVRDEDDGRLTDNELVTMAVTLITAGYVTTAVVAGIGTVLLCGHDLFPRLREDPSLVAGAVEEMLRFQTAAGDIARTAGEDLELAGVPIRAGDPVVVSLTSANRDERRFADPDRFDVGRRDNGHLTFGHGAHHCLGAGLARIELQVIVERLATRLPGLGLAVPADELTWKRSEMFGDEWPQAVPVTW